MRRASTIEDGVRDMTTTAGGDLARRIRERRLALGLAVEDVAARSGMDPGYLAGLEEQESSALLPGALDRLARALDTTVDELSGGGTQVPPGRQDGGAGGLLSVLDPDECRALMASHGVGRIVYVDDRGPVALPVNFAMDGEDVVFRTTWDASVVGLHQLSFEVDNVDGPLAEGWSVLVTGACTVEDVGAVSSPVDVRPWASGTRDCLVRVHPSVITGRRIRRT